MGIVQQLQLKCKFPHHYHFDVSKPSLSQAEAHALPLFHSQESTLKSNPQTEFCSMLLQ